MPVGSIRRGRVIRRTEPDVECDIYGLKHICLRCKLGNRITPAVMS
jgi:hypothetical protein